MNIFLLSRDPIQCAQMHCDQHLTKMILETAQMLSTVQRETFGKTDERLYKSTHINHPCVKWTMESKANYHWLYCLFVQLCYEYNNRFGKTHACWEKWEAFVRCGEVPRDSYGNLKLTPFALCVDDEIKEEFSDAPVAAYRLYYQRKAEQWWNDGKPMRYTKRDAPSFVAARALEVE